jgi:glycosyltransferase involved in cell wall biosynthesis
MRGQELLISVVMPAYNSARFLAPAIRSILNQTYRNLELIIVYDRSSDDTESIIQAVAREDPRVRPLLNQGEHRFYRLPLALNNGLAACRGSFIARMDADDVALPDRLEKQLDFMLDNPDVTVCGTAAVLIDEQDRETGLHRPVTGPRNVRILLDYATPLFHPTWLIRRGILEKVPGYREMYAEDYDFLARIVDAGGRLENIPDVGLRYRQNPTHRASIKTHKCFVYALRLRRERRHSSGRDSYSVEQALAASQPRRGSRMERTGVRFLTTGFERLATGRLSGYALLLSGLFLLPDSRSVALGKVAARLRLLLERIRA